MDDNPSIEYLKERVSHLEKQAVRTQTVLGASCLCALGGMLLGAGSGLTDGELEFRLVDTKGRMRALLDCTENGPQLVFYSEEGAPLATMTDALISFSEDPHSPVFRGKESTLTWQSLLFHDDNMRTDSELGSSRIAFTGGAFYAKDSGPRSQLPHFVRDDRCYSVSLGVQRTVLEKSPLSFAELLNATPEEMAANAARVQKAIVDEPFLNFTLQSPDLHGLDMLHLGLEADLKGGIDKAAPFTERDVVHRPRIAMSDIEHMNGISINDSSVALWKHRSSAELVPEHWRLVKHDDLAAVELGLQGTDLSPQVVLRDDEWNDRTVIGAVSLVDQDGTATKTSPASVVLFDKEARVVYRLPPPK